MRCKTTYLFFLLLWAVNAEAQQIVDTTLVIKEVEIQSNRIPETQPGLNLNQIDVSKPQQAAFTTADILQRNSAGFIKQYSPGALATPSLRGTGAAHTATIWNGLNLQNGMNGQLDLNLLPAFLFGSIAVQEGANSANWGSGAIGATLFLQPSKIENHVSVEQLLGSWNQQRTAFSAGISKKIWSASVKAFNYTSVNDFNYINTAELGNPARNQHNAQVKFGGLMQELNIKPSKSQTIKIATWWQKSNRNIPSIMTVPVSKAAQQDAALRITAQWKYEVERFLINLRSAYFDESIQFNDSLASIYSINKSKTYIQDADFSYRIKQTTFQIGLNDTRVVATADGFDGHQHSQTRTALFASVRSLFFKNKLNVLASARQEQLNGKMLAFAPSFSFKYLINKTLHVKGQVAKTYRIPTLNDIYWIPGGNKDLQPESGICSEVTVGAEIKKLQFLFTGFYNDIQHWIQWIPGNNYWSPQNIDNVISKGVSMQLKWNKNIRKVQLFATLQAQYTETSRKQLQLIYSPNISANQNIGLEWKGMEATFQTHYTGSSYITTDNTASLPGYFVSNVQLSKTVKYQRISGNFFLNINNIFNTTYQVMAWRAMPLRWFQTGLRITFFKNKNK